VINAVETDVIVIGSGIGGLCCGALLARYGFKVTLCESHTIPGGAAHGFERQGFSFDSGPSLYSGMSYRPSTNPLRHVLDALDETVTWANSTPGEYVFRKAILIPPWAMTSLPRCCTNYGGSPPCKNGDDCKR
jgi:phytoene dehydrogenase-like protein